MAIIGKPITLGGKGGGTFPTIAVSAETGATITATNGNESISFDEVDSGLYVGYPTDYGTWTVTAVSGSRGATATVDVTEVMLYSISMTLFGATLAITAPSGATVTVVDPNGTTVNTHTATGSVVDVTVYSAGTYTITAVDGADEASTTATVTSDGESVQVNVQFLPATPEDATWAQISELSQAGTAGDVWSVGDTKTIVLNGTVGTKSYSNVTLKVFILHFNMPVNKTVADNNIIWGGFKTTGGVDVALDDDACGNSGGTNGAKKFAMNHWGSSSYPYNTNYGGWAACDLRYDILGAVSTAPSNYGSIKTTSATGSNATQAAITSPVSNTLMAALPSDFRNVLRLWTRWVDNKGNDSNVDTNVTAIVDAGISLLTEFEVLGTHWYANQYEPNHQTQCAYYANGNSKIKYRQTATTTAANWWESSASYTNAAGFCCVRDNGNAYMSGSRTSYGLAPAFKT